MYPCKRRSPSICHARRLHHGLQQDIGAVRGPFLGDLLGLVVAEAVDAGTHDHGGRRDAVDPAGVVAGARDDVGVGEAEPLGGITHGLHAGHVEGHRIEMAHLVDGDIDIERLGNRIDAVLDPLAHRIEEGERMSMVKTHLPGMMLREFG